MESKLKQLKVVDLKDILSKASVSVTGKANKQDLIAKILGSPDAIDVYNKNYGPAPAAPIPNASATLAAAPAKQEVPQPPKAPAISSPPQQSNGSPASKPASTAAPKASAEPSSPPKHAESSPTAANTAVDDELERRKARAARFGIPLVEPKDVPTPSQKNGKAADTSKPAKVPEDPDKLAARAARFGIQASSPTDSTKSNGKKRGAPPADPVDEEELARRKRRAERFGIPVANA